MTKALARLEGVSVRTLLMALSNAAFSGGLNISIILLRYLVKLAISMSIYLIVHILVSSNTASYPCWTDSLRSDANSWLLKILNEWFGGILQTVDGCRPWKWLLLREWTKIARSDRHSTNTSPFLLVNRIPKRINLNYYHVLWQFLSSKSFHCYLLII